MAEATKEVPPIWTTGWTDSLNTGTWRSALPVHQRRPAPCHGACPVHGEIPTWVQLVKNERYYEAWLALVANNPFPAVTGRICHHPCEGFCNRGEYDGAVSVNALEQFIGDMALQEDWVLPSPQTMIKQRVAIIGGGPAGLSCAYQLRLQGYQVTLIEAKAELGGVLRYGIPEYRLPKKILNQEIQRLLALGFEIQSNRWIKAEEIVALEKEYVAVFLAIGAQKAKTLPLFSAQDSAIDGLQFLARVNLGDIPELGEHVTVIGGGSVAMDVARTARRMGSQVRVLALESRESLPAQADEVKEALEEGVSIIGGAMVLAAEFHQGKLNMNCTKVMLDPEADGLKPVVLPETGFNVQADKVILAIGQDPDLQAWENKLATSGGVVTVTGSCATTRQGVFAGGDVASSERYVSAAIGQGKKAGSAIIRYLGGDILEESNNLEAEAVTFQEINTFYFPILTKDHKETVSAELRLQDFSEVKTGFTVQQAQAQAERCFSCGNCLECDNCFYFCPDMAVVKEPSLAENYRILDQYCKGCGTCVEECPRGAVVLKEETR